MYVPPWPMLVLSLIVTLSHVDLEWSAPPSCPSVDHVQQRLESTLDRADLAHVSLELVVTIEPKAERLSLNLAIDDGTGPMRHEASSRDCATLIEAIELQTLMAAAGDPGPQPEPGPAPAPEPEPAPQPVSRPEPAPLPPRLRATAWAEAGVGGFRVPALDVRWSVGAGVRRAAWSAELGFTQTPTGRAPHPELAGVGVDVRHWSIVGRGCWSYGWRKLEVPLCGALEAGAISVIGVGIERPRRARGPWVAMLPRVGLQWAPTPRFAAGLAVEGYGALVVSPATVQDEDPWFTSGRFGVTGLGRLELRLP